MIAYAGALEDGGAALRKRELTPHPVGALSLVEATKQAVRSRFPLMGEQEVEAVVLRAMYGHLKPGHA